MQTERLDCPAATLTRLPLREATTEASVRSSRWCAGAPRLSRMPKKAAAWRADSRCRQEAASAARDRG